MCVFVCVCVCFLCLFISASILQDGLVMQFSAILHNCRLKDILLVSKEEGVVSPVFPSLCVLSMYVYRT